VNLTNFLQSRENWRLPKLSSNCVDNSPSSKVVCRSRECFGFTEFVSRTGARRGRPYNSINQTGPVLPNERVFSTKTFPLINTAKYTRLLPTTVTRISSPTIFRVVDRLIYEPPVVVARITARWRPLLVFNTSLTRSLSIIFFVQSSSLRTADATYCVTT